MKSRQSDRTKPVNDIQNRQEREASMTLRNPNRFPTSGRIALSVLAGIFFLGPALTAHTQSNGDNSQRGLEGAWRQQITVRDCNTGQALRTFPTVATFAQGGTANVITAGQLPSLYTAGLGAWKHTEDHNYAVVTDAFLFSPAGVWIQTHTLTWTIQVSIDGDTFTNTIALQIFDSGGNLIATGCATSLATRLE
jgi:hypothetical protein